MLAVLFSVPPAASFVLTGAASDGSELFHDYGVTYYAAGRLNAGARLYADVAYPYGPLPVHLWAAASRVVGNTPPGYALFCWVATLLFVGTLYVAVTRATGRLAALVVCGCGLPLAGVIPYQLFERLLFAALVALWVPPADRRLRRAAAVGGLIGAWQWVKFGGAVYAAGALLVVDVAVLVAGRATRAEVRRWAGGTAVAAAAAAAIELGRVGWAFAALPPEVAGDVVWPAYTGQLYRTSAQRYPGWDGWRYLVLQQLVPATGLGAAVVAGWVVVTGVRRGRPAARRSAALLVPPTFYLLGVGTYLGHAHLYQFYAWCLMPAAAVLVGRRPAVALLLVALWLPWNWFAARRAVIGHPPRPVETLPGGYPVAWRPEHRAVYQALADEAAKWAADSDARPLIMPVGSGFYHVQGLTPPSRHTWLLPHYFRPYDEPEFLAAVEHIPFVAFADVQPVDPRADLRTLVEPTFGPRIAAALAGRVREEVRVSSTCRIFRLRETATPGR